MWGHTVRASTYYRCTPDKRHHAPPPLVRRPPDERGRPRRRDHDTAQSLLRATHLRGRSHRPPRPGDQRVCGRRQLGGASSIAHRRDHEPSAAPDQAHFRARTVRVVRRRRLRPSVAFRYPRLIPEHFTEQRKKSYQLAELTQQSQSRPTTNPALLESVPQTNIDVSRLPEDRQRRQFDAFHLELRYHELTRQLDIRVTITGDTATELSATVEAILGQPDGALTSE